MNIPPTGPRRPTASSPYTGTGTGTGGTPTRRHLTTSPLVGSAGSAMTVELELSSSESPSDYETTAEDLLLSTSYTTAGSLSPTSPTFSHTGGTPTTIGTPQLPPPATQMEAVEQHMQQLELDMQGIPWGRANVTREQFRANRIATYLQYERDRGYRTNVGVPLFDDSAQFYRFKFMNRFEGCSVQHFQLKHLIHCPTPFTLFYPLYNRVKRLQPLRPDCPSTTTINLAERFGAGFSRISSFLATAEVGIVGGLFGEVVVWRWGVAAEEKGTASLSVLQSTDPANAVINHISPCCDDRVFVSCNDGSLRLFDVSNNTVTNTYTAPWAINATLVNPVYGHILGLVGDSPHSLLLDNRSNTLITRLPGHDDCSFSIAWRPDGLHMATANQDRTVIVRDVRQPDQILSRRRTFMSVPRSLRYRPDGRLLAIATADDYVHLVETGAYERGQVIDFFGDIAGLDFGDWSGGDQLGDRLYIGCANPHQGGIICFAPC